MKSKQESKRDSKGLIPAYGGKLKELIISDENLKAKLLSKVSYEHECSERNACDVELLMVGGFSPLEGFMNEEDYKSVIRNHRDSKGLLFGLPIVVIALLQFGERPKLWDDMFLLNSAGPSGAMAFALALFYHTKTDTIAPVIIWTSVMTLFSLAWLA